jgi:methyl-accepting chemotaxis protein
VQQVSSNIGGVTQAADDTGRAAGRMLAATGDLAKQSETLRAEVDLFLRDIKAA